MAKQTNGDTYETMMERSHEALKKEREDILAKKEGYETVDALLEASVFDSVCPCICTELTCDYIDSLEPDQDRGWCENCDKGTMKSALILAGLI